MKMLAPADDRGCRRFQNGDHFMHDISYTCCGATSESGRANVDRFSDLTIISADGVRFSAHRLVLAAFSKFLLGVFVQNEMESSDTSVNGEHRWLLYFDYDSQTIEHLLQLIYQGRVLRRSDDHSFLRSFVRLLETISYERLAEIDCDLRDGDGEVAADDCCESTALAAENKIARRRVSVREIASEDRAQNARSSDFVVSADNSARAARLFGGCLSQLKVLADDDDGDYDDSASVVEPIVHIDEGPLPSVEVKQEVTATTNSPPRRRSSDPKSKNSMRRNKRMRLSRRRMVADDGNDRVPSEQLSAKRNKKRRGLSGCNTVALGDEIKTNVLRRRKQRTTIVPTDCVETIIEGKSEAKPRRRKTRTVVDRALTNGENAVDASSEPDAAVVGDADAAAGAAADGVPPETYMCHVCSKVFKVKQYLSKHLQSVHSDQPVPCSYCKKYFKNENSLKEHMFFHTNPRRYSCTLCDSAFPQHIQYQDHMLLHSGEKPYTCPKPECDSRFRFRSALRYHIQSKHSERQFACQQCNQMFVARHQLITHLVVHSNVRNFVCQVCSMSFKNLIGLRGHEKDVHGEAKLLCTHCGEKFKRSRDLKKHIDRNHTGASAAAAARSNGASCNGNKLDVSFGATSDEKDAFSGDLLSSAASSMIQEQQSHSIAASATPNATNRQSFSAHNSNKLASSASRDFNSIASPASAAAATAGNPLVGTSYAAYMFGEFLNR